MILTNGQIVKVLTKQPQDINIKEYLPTVKSLKEFQYILEGQSISVHLKITNQMDMELSFGQMVINTMENGKMAKVMVTEPKYGLMEENI